MACHQAAVRGAALDGSGGARGPSRPRSPGACGSGTAQRQAGRARAAGRAGREFSRCRAEAEGEPLQPKAGRQHLVIKGAAPPQNQLCRLQSGSRPTSRSEPPSKCTCPGNPHAELGLRLLRASEAPQSWQPLTAPTPAPLDRSAAGGQAAYSSPLQGHGRDGRHCHGKGRCLASHSSLGTVFRPPPCPWRGATRASGGGGLSERGGPQPQALPCSRVGRSRLTRPVCRETSWGRAGSGTWPQPQQVMP